MRPLLLGMNHPKSLDPGEALAPGAPGTAGARLFALVRTTLPAYSEPDHRVAFDRRNFLLDTRWSPALARRERATVLQSLCGRRGGTVVLLGREVRDLLGVPREWSWVLPFDHSAGFTVRCLPHPSGLSRWYNDPTQRQIAGLMLAELAAASLREQSHPTRHLGL